jgi:hypothetical protein
LRPARSISCGSARRSWTSWRTARRRHFAQGVRAPLTEAGIHALGRFYARLGAVLRSAPVRAARPGHKICKENIPCGDEVSIGSRPEAVRWSRLDGSPSGRGGRGRILPHQAGELGAGEPPEPYSRKIRSQPAAVSSSFCGPAHRRGAGRSEQGAFARQSSHIFVCLRVGRMPPNRRVRASAPSQAQAGFVRPRGLRITRHSGTPGGLTSWARALYFSAGRSVKGGIRPVI